MDPSPLWPKAAKQRLIGRRLRVNGFLASGPNLLWALAPWLSWEDRWAKLEPLS